MSKHKHFEVPEILQYFQVSINNSAMQYAAITQTDEPPTLYNSKFGGHPYLPLSSQHPKDEDGQAMLLLAQINFSEVQLEAPFPKDGLLQFFIAQNYYEKMQYQPNVFNSSTNYSVRYYSYLLDEDDIVHDFSYLDDCQKDNFPIKKEKRILFNTYTEPVSATDYHLYNFFDKKTFKQVISDDGRTFEDIYLQNYLAAEHKVGGYPYFLHEDIRYQSVHHRQYDTLLLQIISDDEDDIMWGDAGVIKFFINKERLEKLDFSNAFLYAEDY